MSIFIPKYIIIFKIQAILRFLDNKIKEPIFPDYAVFASLSNISNWAKQSKNTHFLKRYKKRIF